jgi:CDP-glycerol glycerophosphotransferase (TagB/SpsB family)
MPLKTIGIFSGLDEKSVPAGDVAIATSPLFAEVMAEAFAMPRDSVWVTGLPRNDKLFAKARLGGGTTTKIVWMPTYRNSYHGEIRQDTGGVCENAIEDHIRSLDRRLSGRNSDVEFVVRLHPMDVLNTVCWDDLKSIKMILGSNPEPLEDTLASSDRLITDYSSVFIDYAILRRPMGFFIPDIGNYIRGFIPKVEEEICWPGTVMKTIDEIEDFVFSERLPVVDDDVLARLHSYRDAFSTRRLYDRLVEIGAF